MHSGWRGEPVRISPPMTRSEVPTAAIQQSGDHQGDETVVAPNGSYDAAYYHAHCGIEYGRTDHWVEFFGRVADLIVKEIAPKTSLDAGCAMGILVESLYDRGVDASGFDISEYAISQVRNDIKERCTVRSILEPLDRKFDLITCVEVLEHLAAKDAERAVENLCAATDDIIFSSTPIDFQEETHINVRPVEYWCELFARQGFFHDLTFDLADLAPWAMRFRRAKEPVHRLVREYERELWFLRNEANERNQTLLRQLEELNRLRPGAAGSENLQQEAEALRKQLRVQEAELRDWRYSRAGKIARVFRHVALAAAPPESARRKAIRALTPASQRRRVRGEREQRSLDEQYEQWRQEHEPSWAELNRMRSKNRSWSSRPLVSIVMPVYNPHPSWVTDAIESVLAQVYENWELCICDDASPNSRVREVLSQYSALDSRIKVMTRETNGGISAASADALSMATGEFVGFLDHDDVLRPHALHRVVDAMREHEEGDLFYSDEDLLQANGKFGRPAFKPDWSPNLLLSVNYICHFTVIRRDVIEKAGGIRLGFDGAQDHDLVLRCSEISRKVVHIADVLYGWRQVQGSVASSGDAKMYAYEAGRKAVEEALARRGLSGVVELDRPLGFYRMRLRLPVEPAVTIVVPTRDRADLLRNCIESIETLSTYKNYSILVIDNDSKEPETKAYLGSLRHKVIRMPGKFNYSRMINRARRETDADYILTLNNDTVVRNHDWIEALLEQGQRPEVGVVGARLVYPTGVPQHEGIAVRHFSERSFAANLRAGWWATAIRDVSAVTGACQLIKASVFDSVGGYEESMGVALGDVDFCLRVRKAGYQVIYTPHAQLIHLESASRGSNSPVKDEAAFFARWSHDDEIFDPFLSIHLGWLDPLTIRQGQPVSAS